MNTEDLSYSNIVGIVQQKKDVAASLIDGFAKERVEILSDITKCENQLKSLKTREQMLLDAARHIVQHLKLDLPLSVSMNGYLVIVSQNNLMIDRNVIKPSEPKTP